MQSDYVWPFMHGFFHIIHYFQGSSILAVTYISTSFLFYYRIIFHCIIPNLFICLWIGEHLDYFEFFPIRSNAAKNICVRVLSGCVFLFLLDIYLRVILLGHMVVPFKLITFWGMFYSTIKVKITRSDYSCSQEVRKHLFHCLFTKL